jgi:hypothetical protein
MQNREYGIAKLERLAIVQIRAGWVTKDLAFEAGSLNADDFIFIEGNPCASA